MLTLLAIKTPTGYLVAESGYKAYGGNNLTNYLFNGIQSERTWHDRWRFVRTDRPLHITKSAPRKRVNQRYELRDQSLASSVIPLVIPENEAVFRDSDGDICWHDKYRSLAPLYEYVNDWEDVPPDPVEFEIIQLAEIDYEFVNVVNLTGFIGRNTYTINDKLVGHSLLDQIFYPAPLLQDTPARLGSKEMYDVIRAYIKDHIDRRYAEITSDYDFCFTVKKRLSLAKPYETTHELLNSRGKSFKNRRFNTRMVTDRLVEVFEMTHDKSKYKGYTSYPAVQAANNQELQEKVEQLLRDLITMINEPLVECPTCKGHGAILESEKMQCKE